jgi:hypothetical protein
MRKTPFTSYSRKVERKNKRLAKHKAQKKYHYLRKERNAARNTNSEVVFVDGLVFRVGDK